MNLFGRKPSPVAKPASPPEPLAVASAAAAPSAAEAVPAAEPVASESAVLEAVAPESVAVVPAEEIAAAAPVDAPTAEEAPPVEPAAAAPVPHLSTAARLAFLDKGNAMTTNPPKPPAASFLSGPARTDLPRADQPPRRVLDMPGAAALPGARRMDVPPGAPIAEPVLAPPPSVAAAEPQRRLTVGRDISLAGEIASCDVLVVEGTVEAKLRDGHSIEVTETGLFKGSVEIDDADIGGRFEGDLVVRNRLRVRSAGKIIGSVVYGELEVENGGQIVGTIKLYDPQPKTEIAAAPVETAPLADVQPAQLYTPTAG